MCARCPSSFIEPARGTNFKTRSALPARSAPHPRVKVALHRVLCRDGGCHWVRWPGEHWPTFWAAMIQTEAADDPKTSRAIWAYPKCGPSTRTRRTCAAWPACPRIDRCSAIPRMLLLIKRELFPQRDDVAGAHRSRRASPQANPVTETEPRIQQQPKLAIAQHDGLLSDRPSYRCS